jgi:small subunit ribosomal protein S23
LPVQLTGSIDSQFGQPGARKSCSSFYRPKQELPFRSYQIEMPRRLGATVPQTVSRLLQGGLLPRPPAWFTAVASVAPLRPSLTKRVPRQEPEPSTSSSSSSSSSHSELEYAWKGSRKLKSANAKRQLKYRPAKPAPIKGLELQDKIRKTFYEDHPFEAFRGISLVEQDSILGEASKPGPTGKNWTELRQRSSNPSPEE